VISFIESNGWYLLIGGIIIYYIYNKYKDQITNTTQAYRHKKEVKEDDTVLLDRLQRMEAARERQQRQLDLAAAKYLEEKKLKEERLAKEKQEEWERHQQGLGYRSKTKRNDDDLSALGLAQQNKSKSSKKSTLRDDDYNPLTGSSSTDYGSCGFRSNRNAGRKGG
jgi:hypothetical protein